MKEEDSLRVLRSLLISEGAEWHEENGWLRFRSKQGPMLWETCCMAVPNAVLIYGRFPFFCRDADRARRLCDELNGRFVRGALFITDEGAPVYRCTAETDDIYGAEQRIAEALRYSAQVIAHCWGRFSGI